ncbi:biliverdin-producing heme oxygenase [Caldichromatium japonicum]|uniref:Biliverdin-producing heme oxygenase n=1 Tax=Caldichromatium japonicum TaxID=2699430 RepID=A0A6G7VCW3_9GAMM|nr:biliverdin-producing heme oxygenase [Caldichromatium japonicum]QIK37792.1 biliverdin-producing heme oxygenase [Caldichromatium japonicum]
MTEPPIDLALALRRATASIHAEVERLDLMASLVSEGVTLEDYRRYLRVIASIHAPIEEMLYSQIDDAIRTRLGLRPKLPALIEDLREQGLLWRPHQIGVIPPPLLPVDLSYAIGGLYVVEGSTLGGHTIARHLRRRLGDTVGGTRLLDFHGLQTAAAWRIFTTGLNESAAEGLLVPERVIAGALEIFSHIYRCLELVKLQP